MLSKSPSSILLAGLLFLTCTACNLFSAREPADVPQAEGSFDAEGKPVSPTPTLTPTETPTPTGTLIPPTHTPRPTATQTSTPSPSAAPTVTNTPGPGGFPPIIPPIIIGTLISIDPLPPPRLDYTASPNYGSANLSAGFSPDPYSVGMTSGGNVDVSYLGASCSGFATSSPDFRINFSSGGSLLRIYFIGSNGDTTLILNDPYGNYYCVDDSFGTVNPTIDFNNPAGGTYDIWVGTYASGTFVSGTLYITELSGNHP